MHEILSETLGAFWNLSKSSSTNISLILLEAPPSECPLRVVLRHVDRALASVGFLVYLALSVRSDTDYYT